MINCGKEINVYKGQDCNVQISLFDQAGNLIDGSPFKIGVFVKHSNGTLIAKFSKNTGTGYNVMDTSNEAAGVVTIKLLSVHTNAAPEGKLFYETKLQVADSSSTDDSVLDLISSPTYCCTIVKSESGSISLP
jgi:hypothetical protein